MANANDEIVISGVGGYFPKSINIEQFGDVLMKNEPLLESRWREGEKGVTNLIGKIPSCEVFDTAFFGIHRQQCTFMDPMQRLALERTFEALLDAGINPADIRGKRIGVFTGSTVGENDSLFYESVVSGFGITGHARSMMANRISYWLNLKGPSSAFDSNWLSGLEVLQVATSAIQNGYCEAAIVATVNLDLNAEISWQYNNLGLISADGSTKSFDENASGYGRSDGVVVLYIQRACDAKRCYATVVSVKTHYNGNREGPFLDLSLPHLTKFLGDFYAETGVDPRDVQFVEAYGAAIKKIDEIEVQALDETFCKDRKEPLLIGSVKTNCGHSEACASFTAIVKVLIAMEAGTIPASINYAQPNAKIPALVDGRIQVLTENKEWAPTLAAVNCIGLSSSYGHVLLRAHPKIKTERIENILPRLIVTSTRTEQGIQDILTTVTSRKQLDEEYIALIQDVFAKPIQGHLYRGYAILDETNDDIRKDFQHFPGLKRPIWFVYSGMGSQWCKMANDLMVLPIFANSIHKCHEILLPKDIDLIKILTEDDPKIFDNILHSFVGIAAMQIALTDVLHALGIVPDGIIGHSVGELGCAYADGCLTAEQMILAAYSRGKASLEAELIDGMMAAVGIGYKHIKDKVPASIEVACHNGPDSSTISGPTADMEEFVKELQDKGTFARLVNVSNIAYHSQYIQPAGPLLLKYLKEVIPEPMARSPKWISTSIPEEEWKNDLAKTSSAEYHTNNLLSQVLFEEGSTHIPKEAVVIEIAPHGLLQAILKRSLKADCTNVPLTQKGNKSGLHFLLAAIGKLYVAGLEMNVSAIYPRVEYPVSRGTPSLAPLAQWEHSEIWRTGTEDKLNYLANGIEFNVSLDGEDLKDFFGNQIEGNTILPPCAYFKMIHTILQQKSTDAINELIFENVQFRNILIIPKIGNISVSAMVQKGSGDFEILSDKDTILSGRVKIPEATDKLFIDAPRVNVDENALLLSKNDVYNEFSHRGHTYNNTFKMIKSLNLGENGSVVSSKWNNDLWWFMESLFQQYLFRSGEKHQSAMSVCAVQRIGLTFIDNPTESCDVDVEHHFASGVITSKYVQVCGVKSQVVDLPKKELSKLLIEYVPLVGTICRTREMIVNWSLHTIIENYVGSNLAIVEVETCNASFLQPIQTVLSKYQLINANISSKKNLNAVVASQTELTMLVYNGCINAKLADILVVSNGLITALIRTSKDILAFPNIVQLMQFTYNNESYSLIRKAEIDQPIVIEISTNAFAAKDLTRSNIQWVSELNNALKGLSQIYLVANSVPFEGMYNFVKSVAEITGSSRIRSLFILDKRVPNFNLSSAFYQNIFKQNTILTVLKDGCVGTYLPVSAELKDDIHVTTDVLSNIPGLARTDYIGFAAKDESFPTTAVPNQRNQVGNIDYCGIDNQGKRMMGIAYFDQTECKIVPDPILQWEYPAMFPAEDAATVPHAYAMAYYLLIHHAQLKIGDTVLIHAGCSPLGFACLSVCSSYGCQMYTTVATDYQKGYLTKQFRNLNERHIFSANNTNFETEFMIATNGDGANVIVNTLTGPALQASFRCTAEFGNFIQVGTLETEQWSKLGTFAFLRNVSFKNVTSDSIFALTDAEKAAIHKLVVKGMDDLFVRPLTRKVMEPNQSIESVLSTIKDIKYIGKMIHKVSNNLPLSELNVTKKNKYICNSKQSYLIAGGTSEMWIDVAEWLIARGASKIVIASNYKAQEHFINRRLTLLQSYYDAEIIFTSNLGSTRESALELISEVYHLGAIGGVFVLPFRESNKGQEIRMVHYIDAALRTTAPKANLINFMENAAGIVQVRADAGFPTYNIQWDSTLNYTNSLNCLDDILRTNLKHVILVNDKLTGLLQESTQVLFTKLSMILPNTTEDIEYPVVTIATKPHFTQLPSLSSIIKEVPPVFIIPGISGRKIIAEFSKQLFYPVYCAVIPPTKQTIKEISTDLTNAMKLILPNGPFNIIGISCGGPLALEIARYLEGNGDKVQVSLIDGAPDTIQSSLALLGEDKMREIGILCRIFNITDSEIIEKLVSLPSWDSRVSYIVTQQINQKETRHIQESLQSIRQYLDEISVLEPPKDRIRSPVYLLRPFGCNEYDNCGLVKYCEQNAEINIIEGDHRSIISHQMTAKIINDKVMC